MPGLLRPRLRFPSSTAYLDAGAYFEPAAHAPANTQRVGDGSPALRKTGSFEEWQGPPGLLGRPLRTCRGATPRRTRLSSPLLLFEKIHGESAIAFRENRTLGIRKVIVFEATYPRPTRSRAYDNALLVTETVARLATGSGGLTPGRAGFAPAG